MILGRIKRLLGMGDGPEEEGDRRSTTVSVEHDPEDPQVSTEEAVKGTGTDGDADPVAADTDAAASTGSLTDEDSMDDPAEAAEPAEAVGPETDDIETDSTTDASPDHPDEEGTSGGEPVDTVTGIGPAYAERLNEIGIQTTADLADANAGSVATQISVSESRVERWISRARGEDT